MGLARIPNRWKIKKNSRDPSERKALAKYLGHRKDLTGAFLLLEKLLEDKNPRVRDMALQSLAKIESCESIFKVMKRLNDKDAMVRAEALNTLIVIGDKRAIPAMIEKLSDSNHIVRSYAATSIAELGGTRHKALLRKRLKIEKNSYVKAGLLEGLYCLGEESRLFEILALLKCESFNTRFYIVRNILTSISIRRKYRETVIQALRKAYDFETGARTRMAIRGTLFKLDRKLKNCGELSPVMHMKPLFDGIPTEGGIRLPFHSCNGYNISIDWNRYSHISQRVKKEFLSKDWTVVTEFWEDKRMYVEIHSIYFCCAEDALLFPEIGNTVMSPGFKKSGKWSKSADIGDKTCWISPKDVLFAKGNVLLRVHSNKAYAREIAQKIEKKIKLPATPPPFEEPVKWN